MSVFNEPRYLIFPKLVSVGECCPVAPCRSSSCASGSSDPVGRLESRPVATGVAQAVTRANDHPLRLSQCCSGQGNGGWAAHPSATGSLALIMGRASGSQCLFRSTLLCAIPSLRDSSDFRALAFVSRVCSCITHRHQDHPRHARDRFTSSHSLDLRCWSLPLHICALMGFHVGSSPLLHRPLRTMTACSMLLPLPFFPLPLHLVAQPLGNETTIDLLLLFLTATSVCQAHPCLP